MHRKAAHPARFVLTSILLLQSLCLAHASAPTVTTLAVSPSSVSAGTVATLTATVTSGADAVSPGLVIFCNAAAVHCEDAAILGQAQLTSAGVATLRLRLGIGSHSIKAIFQGTPHSPAPMAASTSATQTLDVTGSATTSTTITYVPGAPYSYKFSATVNAFGRSIPGGNVSFADVNHGDQVLGSASLNFGSDPISFIPIETPTSFYPFAVLAADFNNDGIPDLLTVGFIFSTSPGTILLGKGDGTFTPSSTSPEVGAYSVAADFNSDGILDLATIDTVDGSLKILLGKGDGTFNTKSSLNVLASEYPAVADFNGDGIPDLVLFAGIDSGANYTTVLLGNGDGTFTVQSSFNEGIYNPAPVVLADFNNDGITDFAFTNSGTLYISLSKGDGTFTSSTIDVSSFNSPAFYSVGDFNGDGIPDLGFSDETLLGKGNGTFKTISNTAFFYSPFVAADFNGDGILDLGSNELVYLGKGDGTFPTQVGTQVNNVDYVFNLVTADLNGDGVPDRVYTFGGPQGTNNVHALLGGFTATNSISAVSFAAGGVYDIEATYSGDSTYPQSSSLPAVISTIPAPTLSPAPGTYQWTQDVVISDAAPRSVLYYTLDGSEPTTSSLKYTAPIPVTWQSTINAVAVTSAGDSPVAVGTYAIDRPSPPPVFSHPSGTYGEPLTFTLTPGPQSCTTGTCVLYYTINGAGYTKYTGPVTINRFGTAHVEAITTAWHYTTSAPASVTYTLQ